MTLAVPLAARGAFRQANTWLRWAPLLPLLVIEADRPAPGRLARISTFLLCCAGPQIAAYLIEMEHSARLDQIRLAGQAPPRIALRLALTVGWPWLASGLVLLAWSLAIGDPASAPLATAAQIGAPTAIAALFTTRAFTRERVDPRILIVGLGFIGALFGSMNDVQGWFARSAPVTAGAVVIVELVAIALLLRGFMHRIAFPPAATAKKGTALDYRPRFLLGAPAMYRGAVLAGSGLLLAIIFAPPIAMLRAQARDPDAVNGSPVVLPPLILGFLIISLICREDAVLGRLDAIRLSAMTPAATALQTIAGLWLPFLLASASLAIIASTMFTVDPLLLAIIFGGLLLVAPLPVVEGWSGLWVLTFSLPYVLAIAINLRSGAFVAVTILGALVWWAAVQRVRDSGRPVLHGWHVPAITALLAAVPWTPGVYPPFAIMSGAAALVAASPLVVREVFKAREFWMTAAVIGAATTAAALPRFGWRGGPGAGLTIALVWAAAVRVHQAGVLTPIEQAAARFGAIVVFPMVVVDADITPFAADNGVPYVIAALGLLIAVEAGLRLRALVTRLVTPRA
jgi:hypothetical protein